MVQSEDQLRIRTPSFRYSTVNEGHEFSAQLRINPLWKIDGFHSCISYLLLYISSIASQNPLSTMDAVVDWGGP